MAESTSESKDAAAPKPTEAAAVTSAPADEGQERTPEQIEAEIEETRGEMGETVAALAEKADVKKQAQEKVEETKQAAKEKASATAEAAKETLHEAPEKASETFDRVLSGIRENPAPAAAAAIAFLAIVLIVRRRG